VLPEPVVRFWLASMELHARSVTTPWGGASADGRWPDVWEANQASVLRPQPSLDLAEIRAVLDPLLDQAGVPTECFQFLDADQSCPALEALEQMGGADEDVVMVFEGPALPPWRHANVPLPVEVTEPDEAFWAFYRTVPSFYGPLSDRVLDQMLDRARTLFSDHLRSFVTTIDGEPVGMASLVLLDGVGEIDNVVTAEAVRGRGIASGGVQACLAAAAEMGAELVFLLAEEDGAPQRLYERIGFRVAARSRTFAIPRSTGARVDPVTGGR
jgi:ribosomal protein S18 acetylase RimI-like enzyme